MTLEEVNLQQVKESLYERLKPSGWARVLRGFIMGEEFDKILEELYKQTKDGKRFTPPLKYLFRAFEECPYEDLKVVMILQDPYPHFGVADGVPMSCSRTGYEQPSLKVVFDALQEMHTHENYKRDVDLARWSRQGVLLVNTALTCQIDKTGTHYDIWKPFISYLLDMLSSQNMGLIWVFFGKKAQEFESLVLDSRHYKFFIKHPASAAYRNSYWEHDDIFPKITNLLKINYNYEITW